MTVLVYNSDYNVAGSESSEPSLSNHEVESIEKVVDKLPESPGVGLLATVAQGKILMTDNPSASVACN